MNESRDFVVIGSGMGGLTVASLLARAGYRVTVLEAHTYPGGCCHTFPMGPYRFCAAVHYIFYCGRGEPIYNFLQKLGLHEHVTFERLDPGGYDHFSCPVERVRFPIPSGLNAWAVSLGDRLPAEREPIAAFFRLIEESVRDLKKLPFDRGLKQRLTAALACPNVMRYRRWTLQDVFDTLNLSPTAQAILATQVGDLGLPPREVSFLAYCGLVSSYGAGAYYPTGHFDHFIRSIEKVIVCGRGCAIHYSSEVAQVDLSQGKIHSVTTSDGREFKADAFICNTDPKRFVESLGHRHFPSSYVKQLDYRYSASSFTVYLGVEGLDLRDHGFGNWNVWHYPHLDINRTYDRQNRAGDLTDPWLFMSTPALCTPQPALCPPGQQILELVTTCNFDRFDALRSTNRAVYTKAKNHARDSMIDIVERDYIPRLRKHLRFRMAGSPTTNIRYLWAPRGHIYGSELSPRNVDFCRPTFKTPISNLYFTGASAEFPSIGATVVGGCRLYTHLTGDSVNGGREMYGMV